MEYKNEIQLYIHIKRYFKNQYFNSFEELSFYERKIDIVSYSKKHEQVIAVEAKLKNWQKAFQQALIYQLCSDLVYIAMPSKRFNYIDEKLFLKRGVGFLGIYPSGRCRELLSSTKSQVLKTYYRKELIRKIRKV